MGGLTMVLRDKDGKVKEEIDWKREVIVVDGKDQGIKFKENKVKK